VLNSQEPKKRTISVAIPCCLTETLGVKILPSVGSEEPGGRIAVVVRCLGNRPVTVTSHALVSLDATSAAACFTLFCDVRLLASYRRDCSFVYSTYQLGHKAGRIGIPWDKRH
jgi:hypothetical protein